MIGKADQPSGLWRVVFLMNSSGMFSVSSIRPGLLSFDNYQRILQKIPQK
jgi:hypothetical protein